jgi:hypothetical protein
MRNCPDEKEEDIRSNSFVYQRSTCIVTNALSWLWPQFIHEDTVLMT